MLLPLGRYRFVVAPLLLAFACSAPPGTGEDADDGDDPLPFSGGIGAGPMLGAAGLQPGASNPAPAPTPASPTQVGGAQNQAAGAAGAPQNGGAGGASGGMPAGAAGASSMPGNPPPVTPPPTQPPPVTPPPVANADCAGQFLCEDFEGLAAGPLVTSPTWQVIADYAATTQNANVAVSTLQAHTGTQSLRVLASQSRFGAVATLPQNRYFLRAWLQLESVPLGPVFIGLGTDQNSETRLRIQGQSFAVINTVGPGDAVRPDQANSGNCPDCVTLAPNRWFCAELFIDNAAQAATLWIDGDEAASIVNGQGGWPVQPAQPRVFLGSMGVQGGQAGVFIDDVVVGSARIGCD